MSQELKDHLEQALVKFTNAREKIEESFGFCRSSEQMRMLEEMIKEQRPNEDTSHSISATR